MMKRLALRFALLVASLILLPVSVHAQLFRAYLASYGNDSNPCTVGAPCRMLPAAIAAVNFGGEIWMLDSANFNAGTVTISKDVVIQAIPGQIGSIVPVGNSPAIIINPGLSVVLRNVAIVTNSNNPGTDGIQMTTGKLSLDNAFVQVATSRYGIYVNGAGFVAVRNSEFRGAYNAIMAAEGASLTVSASKFSGIGNAAVLVFTTTATTTSATLRDCDMADSFVGVWADAATNASARSRVSVYGSTMSNNQFGLISAASTGQSYVSVGASVLSGNSQYAFSQSGTGVIETLGNNVVRNNANVISGTLTTVSTM